MIFVTHEEDRLSVEALDLLKSKGYATKIINQGVAEEKDIAIFSLLNGKRVRFPNGNVRLASHRLKEAAPAWAKDSLYLVCVRRHPCRKTKQGNLEESLEQMACLYQQWFSGIRDSCPWGGKPIGESKEDFRVWKKRVKILDNKEISPKMQTFLERIEPLNQSCSTEFVKRSKDGEVDLISAFCLHSNEARTQIVDQLDPELISAFGKFVEESPIRSLKILAFGPEDWEVIENFDLKEVILPALWGKKEELQKNWNLSLKLASQSPKIELFPLRTIFPTAEEMWVVKKEAEHRAAEMYRRIKKSKTEPPIFKILSEKEKLARLKTEAITYLLVTRKYSNLVYLGFEVHSAYWSSGKLYRFGKKFLPIMMAPTALRQHFGSWAFDEQRRLELKKLFG